MRILVKQGVKWIQVARQPASEEALLERLIQESPEVIPPDPDVALVVYARQFPCPPSYSIDLVGVGSDGGITIVECKLARNTQAKREVVGQILEYAASLWRLDPEDFERRFVDADAKRTGHEGRSPYVLLQEAGAMDAEAIADCQRRVAENLAAGRFRLLIAVDEFSDELKSIIRYVNTHSGDQLTLVALALPEFSDGTTRILIPETFGNEALRPSPRDDTPLPPEEQFARSPSEWREALNRMHGLLTEYFKPRHTRHSISYTAIGAPKPAVAMWPRDGRLYSAESGDVQFERWIDSAKTLGLPVGKMSVKFAEARGDTLESLLQSLREHVLERRTDLPSAAIPLADAGSYPLMSARTGPHEALRTQRVTASDLRGGRIRVPHETKRVFPPERDYVDVVLRGEPLSVRWDPRMGPDQERSGVLLIGRNVLPEKVAENEVLLISKAGDGSIAID